jgi:hypothetical protein
MRASHASARRCALPCQAVVLEAYRTDDNAPIDDAAALEAWSRAGRAVLVQVARRYGALMPPSSFAEEVQAFSGVRTREPAEQWVDDVLDAVDIECVARTEPLLSAFSVRPDDGRVGARYVKLASSVDPSAANDVQMHAANQRLEAHRYHGAILPVDGGKPVLPPQLAKVRASAPKRGASSGTRTRAARPKAATPRKPKNVELPRAVCPTCFLQLPATGRCDNCDPD